MDLDVFAGPLDLLLELVRAHKIDIKNLPLVQLADQYLDFLNRVETGHLAISTEYLAMAAWLVWLKSLSMLPGELPKEEEPEQAAASLSLRLERYAALKRAVADLQTLPQLNRQFFIRRAEGLPTIEETPSTDAALHQLLDAYAGMRLRKELMDLPPPRPVYLQERALVHLDAELENLDAERWVGLEKLLPKRGKSADSCYWRSVVASMFCAALEMARNGKLALLQGDPLPKISKQ